MEPYWRHLNDREQRARERSRVGKLDYDLLLNFGADYMMAEYAYRSRYRNMYISRTGSPDAWKAAEDAWKASSVLSDVAAMAHVPADIIINAARVMNRYYDRGNGLVVDAEKLIRSMI